jgi:hypothetical protein
MEEEYYIIAKWAQEDVETLYNMLHNNKEIGVEINTAKMNRLVNTTQNKIPT